MGDINWSITEARYASKSTLINNNVSRTDWIGFMDALGWMENSGKYGGLGGYNNAYAGIYQVGKNQLNYMNFFDGIGIQFFGNTSKSIANVANNPLAQELAGIMEFSGVPDIGKNFVSKYYAVRSDSNTLSNFPSFSSTKFDQLIGKTITISYTDASGNTVGTDTITLTAAGISAAAHLVGATKMAEAMAEIYSDCFNEQGVQTSSIATLPTTGFADGNGVAFSTYVKLLQNYDISPMLNASGMTDFNTLVSDLITNRKDKIIDYITANKQEAAMSVSYGTTNYRETIRSILQGLDLSTDNLNTVDGQVVLTGANNSKFTDKADLIFGVGNVNNVLTGGKGNDVLVGGAGVDTYIYKAGDGNDQIIDTGENTIIIEDANGNKRTITNVYKTGADVWTTADGKVELTHHSPYQIILEDGSSITLGDNFQDGDFGINLLDMPADPVTTNTILGDQNANNITDTSANDRIETGSGDDTIVADQGGNDEILGGSGRDAISAGYGDDIAEGGTESDIVFGGVGSDQVFGETSGEMETLIANGETAASINEKGDLVSGNDGNDLLYGSNKKDALFGGEGHDLLVGAGGDDAILGDSDASLANIDWSFSVANNQVNFSNVSLEQGTSAGDDTIYAGTGNDFVYGGGGDDEVDAGEGNDIVFGGNFGEMETLIAEGDTATNINEKGDLAFGNDTIFSNYGGSTSIEFRNNILRLAA